MASSAFTFLLICTLLATVSGQSSVVSTNTITTGGKFSVYCDSSRVNAPPNVLSIFSLNIYRNLTATNSYSRIAQYLSITPPGSPGNTTTIPDGRNWTFTLTGANGGAGNIATMKIVWDVNDVSCADAGIYRCVIEYFLTPSGTSSPVQSTDQNVTATTGLSGFDLTVSPIMNDNKYNTDDNITFTCSAVGPATGLNFRWELWIKDQFDFDRSENLPINNEIVNTPPTLQTGNAGCAQYRLMSTLRIQVPDDYEQQSYKCIVTYLQQEASGNMTIGTTGAVNPSEPQGVAQSSSPDVGMIVGIVIGCLVAIAIVIVVVFVIRYFRRSKENRSVNKDQHDAPKDANLNAPPPVFYPSSKKTKPSKDEDTKIPTGMTNDGLDTSYDSRDSVSKGPPRYANAESDAQGPPRYERETHKGRQNRGYDEEEREKNERNERNTGHGRRQPREREERKPRSRDYDDDEPRRRYYTTDDGTDSRIEMGDPNMGTSI